MLRSFKANLENYKVRSLANVFHNSTGHFWEVSGHIMDIIIIIIKIDAKYSIYVNNNL